MYKLFEEEHHDIVVNFAAESHVDCSIEDPSIFQQTNIIGTSVLMDVCRKYGITRYHQVSTDEVYGDLLLDRPDLFFKEDTPLHTSTPYSGNYKPGWDMVRVESSLLGYWDAQQLIVFPWNTPTYTVTALWLSSIKEGWYSLFQRVDK